MRRIAAALGAGFLLLAACGGDGASSKSAGSTTVASTLAPVTTDTADTGAPTTLAGTTTGAPATTAPATTLTTTATTRATTTAKPTTTTAKPTTTTGPPVTFTQFSVTAAACPAPDVSIPITPMVTVKWTIVGVTPDDIYIAVDNKDGPYQSGLAMQGEFELTRSCDGSEHTYYVVAVVDGKQYGRSKKV